MTAQWFSPPSKALDPNADPYSGATWKFYITETLTPQNVFADAGLATSLGDTVTADSAGKFVNIYLDASKLYRAICKDSTGAVTLHDIDPVNPGYLGPGSVNACRLTGTGNVTAATGNPTAVGWNTEIEDVTGMHSLSVNTDEITIIQPGRYNIKAKLLFAFHATGYRRIQLQKNASPLFTWPYSAHPSDSTICFLDEEADLVAGDALRVLGTQNSGGDLAIQRPDSYFYVQLLRAA